jgi:hypothetical protein
MDWDFRSFHVRAINAVSEAEKEAINQELKDLYAGLEEEQKTLFNEQLQAFLLKQYKTLADDYEQVKSSLPSDN